MQSQSNNWSLHSVAGAYMLRLAPHAYYNVKMMMATKFKASTPRENLNTLRSTLPSDIFNKLCRGRGAHLNAFEGFPLFAASMIAGNMASLPSSELNFIAAEYLGARVLYTALYMGARSEFMSYMRTGVCAWSIALLLYGLVKAGKAMPEGDL